MESRATRQKAATHVDRENAAKNVKNAAIKPLARRPALHELGNNGPKNPIKKTLGKISKPKAVEAQPEPVSYSASKLPIVDPDSQDADDELLLPEYVNDIYQYLCEYELNFVVKKEFLEKHNSTAKMRKILVDWLAQVHENFQFYPETLFLCVRLIDRYLEKDRTVGRDNLQLIGIATLSVASKYEEQTFPDIEDYVYVCDRSVTRSQILKAERQVLQGLGFQLGMPLPNVILRRISKIADIAIEEYMLAKYVLELALLNSACSSMRPSHQAAAACFLAMSVMRDQADAAEVWTPTLIKYSAYKHTDFQAVVRHFASLLLEPVNPKYRFISDKYSTTKNGHISLNKKLKGPLVKQLAEKKV